MPTKHAPLPEDLPQRLRAAGLKVVALDGWRSRGRPASTGGFNPRGILIHHTGSKQDGMAYARWLFLKGRADLPAPLCQISIGRDGTVFVGAAGRANHAGRAKAFGSMPAGDGNALYVGIEVHNTGTEGYPAAQYRSMVQTAAVLREILGAELTEISGHFQTSVTGKIDPGNPKNRGGVYWRGYWVLDMNRFRQDVKIARIKAPAGPAPTVPAPKRDRLQEARVLLREAEQVARRRGWRVRAGRIAAARRMLPK